MIRVQGPIGIINFTALLPYSGKFSLVQIFTERKRDALTTPLQMMATPHMHAVYQRPNDEAKQDCATTAYSSFCVEAFAITKVSRLHASAGEKLAC